MVEQKLQKIFTSKSLGSNTTPDALGQLSFCFAFLTKICGKVQSSVEAKMTMGRLYVFSGLWILAELLEQTAIAQGSED